MVKSTCKLFVGLPIVAVCANVTGVIAKDIGDYTYAKAATLHTCDTPNVFKGTIAERVTEE